ncbi:MAG: hypothetical protein VKP57_13025 [Candidatus Sericytochromatia bacterium]|nr:hypothetical protein [Candidatus Sericytochromatia bacterium]
MVARSVFIALIAFLGAGLGLAAPSRAAGLDEDASDLHRTLLARLVGQLVEQGYVAEGERVWWEPAKHPEEPDDRILRAMATHALLERGVLLVRREADAEIRLEASLLRAAGEILYRPDLMQGRPGPAFTLTHRLVARSVVLATGKVRKADVLVVQDQPFAPVERRTASGPDADSVETGRLLQEVQGFGVTLSNLAGSGFSYRRWLASGRGFQISGFPYLNGTDTFFNVGGQVMQSFFEAPDGRGYGLLAAGVGLGSLATSWFGGPAWNLSVGGGADLRLAANLVLSAQLAYSLSAGNRIGPGGGAGLFIEF